LAAYTLGYKQAVVLDLYSRKIVGSAMAPNMPAESVYTAFRIAIAQRRPPPGVIVHSDRGSQYANHADGIRDVTDYILNFYNNRLLHSSSG